MEFDSERFEVVPCPDGFVDCGVLHYREKEYMDAKTVHLVEQIPDFARKHQFVRTDIGEDSAPLPLYGSFTEWVEKPVEEANLITSKTDELPWTQYHRPILDIDFGAALVPSSTPGHFHLYIDRLLEWDQYLKLLKVLVEVNIIQPGFYEGAKRRGATSARLPWIKKGDKRANMLDPDKENRVLREERERLERRLAEINNQLDGVLIEEDDDVW